MSFFRKKPVVIEARQFTGDNAEELANWIGRPPVLSAHAEAVVILTLEGPITASVGDWVIRGVKGEFYPCKPDIFAITYTLEGEPDAW